MERERAISKHEAIVQPFIKDAFKEGAHRKMLKHTPKDRWLRQMMIGVIYNDIGSRATYEELAGERGTFRQSIATSNKILLRNLWNNCPPEIQEKYPLVEVLAARKPWSQRSREESSRKHGGTSLKIKVQVGIGITDIGKISKNTGIPKRTIVADRTTLKGWGVNVPREIASYKEVLKQLDKETDDKKTQELLDQLPYHVINTRKKKGDSQFLAVGTLIREAGFHAHNRDNHFFVDSLKNGGIPITRKDKVVKGAKPQAQTYYILLSRHKDRAEKVLREDQTLQRFQRKFG